MSIHTLRATAQQGVFSDSVAIYKANERKAKALLLCADMA